ncbi:MAG: LysE family transporter [Bacteroidota bacterium]
MSNVLAVLIIALVVSYIGSIPPGTLNLTVIQLGIKGHRSAALSFAVASALVEFFYAGAAVLAQQYFMSNPDLARHFELITAVVLFIIGVINLTYRKKGEESKISISGKSGFWQGFALSCVNPMAIPFWLTVTAALQSAGWITITSFNLVFYLLGISLGTLLLLWQAGLFGQRLTVLQSKPFLMYRLPGFVLLSLSAYTFYNWYL